MLRFTSISCSKSFKYMKKKKVFSVKLHPKSHMNNKFFLLKFFRALLHTKKESKNHVNRLKWEEILFLYTVRLPPPTLSLKGFCTYQAA